MTDIIDVSQLERAPQLMRLFVQGIVATSGDKVTLWVEEGLDELRNYPGETDANEPPPPYYQRGVGMIYKNVIRRTSNQLQERWSQEVTERTENSMTILARNIAQNLLTGQYYAYYTHGEDDPGGGPQQRPFHAARDWPKAEGVISGFVGADRSSPYYRDRQREMEIAVRQVFKETVNSE